MPPKEQAPKKVLFGRSSNTLTMGVVGLANVGKSTFFNVLTNSQVPAENYPFCTIDPTTARAQVPDERWEHLCESYKPKRRIPAFLQVTDIAGLIKGASEGKGLGNQFLSNISAVDGIYHVVRIFEDEDIVHVEGSVDPCRDLDIVCSELRMKDIEVLTSKVEGLERIVGRTNDKVKKFELDTIKKCIELMKSGTDVRFGKWEPNEVEVINTFGLLTTKPQVVLVNMNKESYIHKRGRHVLQVKQWVDEHQPGESMILFSADLERELSEMTPEDRENFCKENKTASAIPKIILVGYSALSLIHFFTAGEDEVRCWTIRHGTKAPRAGAVIHTDFEKGFVCVETMKYEDFKALGSEKAVKEAGKNVTKGKDYEVADGDILLFRYNLGQKK
ncbi:putative GTP-binding protein [Monocercomonoides exilis]|uniref:putative GTP-binding protein n=1 Tax=Monocercomonoides exilis TaxID=2049356 RepID=UPI00355979D1|nr:putative GTP-binding protein [Monocercomonoides exilis]|eukprot:MONOS_1958.1-p1 / transcript=MONOS_1958.1 / gene=MONOS_1958 / organism=Monocercomonoides_exilis_PA203 / gene_product=GTP-binding protein / transcript_product=GTP-binding protein / location=Mono_scaffold00037:153501-154905(-) / protein_length=388 / sequence_SO=supercontig / SO=protein_coding / is_pseudo=false